jgi:hypothetical protein
MNIIDKVTGKVIGSVLTNQSLTFGQAMELAGFLYTDDGWTKDGEVFYDESTAEMCYA